MKSGAGKPIIASLLLGALLSVMAGTASGQNTAPTKEEGGHGRGLADLLLTAGAAPGQGWPPTKEEVGHEKWLVERMQEATSIKTGMSRADLLKVFGADGGLQSIPPERYVLKSCRYIKVEVQFRLGSPRPLAHIPPDEQIVILKISAPYLAYPTED
jgi:hypothetical protein